MVADHLTGCEQCALAVDDLHAFRDQIAPSLDREYHPASVPPAPEGWWHRTVASLSALFKPSPVMAFGAALAVLLVAVAGWLIWQTPREGEPKQEIAVSPATPVTPPQPAPVPPAPVTVVAQLNDGEGQVTLDQEGKLSGTDHLPPAYQSMLKEALTTRRIEKSSQLEGLARPRSPLMSTDKQESEFSVIEPVGKVLTTDRPTFRWSPMEGASVLCSRGLRQQVRPGGHQPATHHPFVGGAVTVARQGLCLAGESHQRRAGVQITAPARATGEIPDS